MQWHIVRVAEKIIEGLLTFFQSFVTNVTAILLAAVIVLSLRHYLPASL
jgi:hypothetical protein